MSSSQLALIRHVAALCEENTAGVEPGLRIGRAALCFTTNSGVSQVLTNKFYTAHACTDTFTHVRSLIASPSMLLVRFSFR